MLGKPTRPGFRTVTPYLIVRELEPMLEFLQSAFGATELFRATGSAGGSHIELRIGDSIIMISGGENGETMAPVPIMIFLYLENVDKVYDAALAAGATSLAEPGPMFGEPRGAGIKDPSGNQWYFAMWEEGPDAPIGYEDLAQEFRPASTAPMLAYEDAPAALEWLANAFGFAETMRIANDDGSIGHAELQTGSGTIMIASAPPAYQSPKQLRTHYQPAKEWFDVPWIINGVHVYVDDVDAHFAQAKAAGATMLSEVEEGGPGRRYRVEDLEGQRWMFMEGAPPKQIQPVNFKKALYMLLDETFDNVRGIYLDKGTSFFETLATISAEEASIPVGGKCATLAAQVKHTAFYLDVLENAVRTLEFTSVDWGKIWRETSAVTPEEWETLKSELRSSYDRIKALIADTDDWADVNRIGGAMGVIAHTAYHLGEIRQALCTIKP